MNRVKHYISLTHSGNSRKAEKSAIKYTCFRILEKGISVILFSLQMIEIELKIKQGHFDTRRRETGKWGKVEGRFISMRIGQKSTFLTIHNI